jgi:hypothetical protein
MSRDRDRGGDVARVYVGDLGSGGSKPELEREFERYGQLKNVWVARNPPGMLLFCNLSPCPRLILDILTSLCEAKLAFFKIQYTNNLASFPACSLH